MSVTLHYALAVSVVLHVLWAAYFFASRREPTVAEKTGTITVDIVQPFEHAPDEHAEPSDSTVKRKHKSSSRPSQPVQPAVGSFQKGDSDAYVAEVTKLIHQRKIYPRSAIEREEEGRVVIGVSVNRAGKILNSVIEVASPFSSLNQAALDTIQSIGQFPALPANAPEPMHLHIPLQFKISRPGG